VPSRTLAFTRLGVGMQMTQSSLSIKALDVSGSDRLASKENYLVTHA